MNATRSEFDGHICGLSFAPERFILTSVGYNELLCKTVEGSAVKNTAAILVQFLVHPDRKTNNQRIRTLTENPVSTH